MKYIAPKYEMALIETEDILTASSDKYEVEQNNGTGKIKMNVFDLFK